MLRLSQPAVTQQVQLLERALGVRLLERVGRNVRLTSAGVEVAGACLLIMRALENLDGVVQAVQGLDLGSVSVGASGLAADYYLPPILTEFMGSHASINLSVMVSDAEDVSQQVVAGEVDCGLIDGPPIPGANLLRTRVAATDVVIVTNSRAIQRECVDDDPFRGARYLVWGPGSETETIAANLLGECYQHAVHLPIGSIETARRMVLAMPGFVTAMPLVAVTDDLASGRLRQVCPRSTALPVYAIRRQGADGPAVEALWQAMTRKR